MIDIHAHILWQVDDGSRDLEMSKEMLRLAASGGTQAIFATPHVIDTYSSEDWQDALDKKKQLEAFAAIEHLPLKIYSGAEVMMNWELLPLLGEDGICCMASSRYMLVELPLYNIPVYADDFWYTLELKGIRPILAHPERYQRLEANYDLLLKWRRQGLLLQCNAGSFTGIFGREVKSDAEKLLAAGLVDFIGSDAHRTYGRNTDMSKAADVIKALAGDEAFERIALKNPQKIIDNEEIEVIPPAPVKKRSWWRKLFS